MQLQTWLERLPFDLNDRTTQCLLAIPATLVAGYAILRWLSSAAHQSNLRRRIRARLQARDAEIEHVRELTTHIEPALEAKVSALDFDRLVAALQSGDVTCQEVLSVYQRKSLISNDLTNCVTGYIREANATATHLDTLARNPDYKKPPLFGVPISIKCCVPIKGYEVSRGYARELEFQAPADSPWVEQLKELGMIPFVFTNVPQSLLTFTCQNPVYGITSNPIGRDRTPGGSSGGEGALIASGGSLVGVGGDIGGSIRIPAAWCGIVGFKPTQGRITWAGEAGSVPGRSHVFGSNGPLARSVSGCVSLCRHTWGVDQFMHRRDAYIPPVAWNEIEFASTKKLRIGYYEYDGFVEAMPMMRRAVAETRAHLERAGHTLVRIEPPGVTEAFYLFMQAVLVDNGAYIVNNLKQDIVQPTSEPQYYGLSMPFWLRYILSYAMRGVSWRFAKLLGSYARTPTDLRNVYEKIEDYWLQWKALMSEQQLDCLICPAFTTPAQRHTDPYWLTFNVIYTALFNLLNYPAGVVPVTKVNAQDLDHLKRYKAHDRFERRMVELTEGTLDFPVAVQVAALPFHDETVLRVMAEIERHVAQKS